MKPPADTSSAELPSYDPWDGDPSEFEAVASALVAREDHTTEVRIGITALLNDPALGRWMGKSADAFRQTLGPLPGLLNQLGHAYFQAAAAIRVYAGRLRDGQASFAKVQASLQAQIATNPANTDGSAAASTLANGADQASSEHRQAKQVCAKEVSAADQDVRRVLTALSDQSFSDFNKTFRNNGGNLADLASLQHMGGDLYTAQMDSIKTTLNGQRGSLPQEVLRAQIQDFLNAFGDVPQAWGGLGPLLGQIPGYLDKNDKLPDGSLPPEDQALLTTLGQATAKAAAAGYLDSLVSSTDTANLPGLIRIVGAAGGGKIFGAGPGAVFLADLATKTTLSGLQDGDSILQALQAAEQNGDAARIALSGANGRQLALQLLKDSTALSTTPPPPLDSDYYRRLGTGADENDSVTIQPAILGGDGSIIHSFLDAALLHGDARTNSVADQQSVTAAYNVIHAVVDYKDWNPTDPRAGATVDKLGLPVNVNNGLIDYANTYAFDLGRSLMGTNATDGLTPLGNIPGGPQTFYVPYSTAQQYLSFTLSDPKAAGNYLGNAEVQLTHAMSLAMKSNSGIDYTGDYANLVAATQKITDSQNLSAAQHNDAIANSRLTLFNSLTGGLGNAPGGTAIGVGQMLDGLLSPVAGGSLFDTSHAQAAITANNLNDLLLNHMGPALATQAAIDAGKLDPAALHSGILSSGNVVLPNQNLLSWYDDNKHMPVSNLMQGDKQVGALTLKDYADELSTAIGEQPTQ